MYNSNPSSLYLCTTSPSVYIVFEYCLYINLCLYIGMARHVMVIILYSLYTQATVAHSNALPRSVVQLTWTAPLSNGTVDFL